MTADFESMRREQDELLLALRGLAGLVKLVSLREDLPADLSVQMTANHRYVTAEAVLAKHKDREPS